MIIDNFENKSSMIPNGKEKDMYKGKILPISLDIRRNTSKLGTNIYIRRELNPIAVFNQRTASLIEDSSHSHFDNVSFFLL